MIQIKSDSTNILVALDNCAAFTSVLGILRDKGFTFSRKTSLWKGNVFQFDAIRSELEEYDVVRVESEPALQLLRDGTPELRISSERIVPDWSLLNYPPVKGKPPYEDYQKQDISAGLARNRYAYFLGMGTGKTYIFSALIAHHCKKWGNVGKVVILTSNIGVGNIYHELFKFIKGLQPAEVAIADVINRTPFTNKLDPAKIVLMNYNTWRLVCNAYKKQLKITATKPKKPFLPLENWFNGSPGMLILDESHLAAIHSSQQSHLLALHAPLFEYRYLFSGTPADKPEKQYNQFKILDEYLVHRMSYTDWLGVYAELGTRFSQYDIREWRYDKLEELNKRFVGRYGIYRKSEDIVELPVHYIKRVYVKMSLQQRRIYEEFIQTSMDEYARSGDLDTRTITNRFPYLMLASENPTLLTKHIDKFGDRLASRILEFSPKHMTKLDALADVIEEQEGKKGVIWVSHPATATMIAERFASLNPLVITGDTPDADRKPILDKFEKDPEHILLIANIKVLNTSVNITWVTWQCYVERIFDYAPYEQSTKRIYRIGQNLPVTTYILLYENSLDILQDKNLTSKGKLVSSLMSKDFLTHEEWVNIFNCKEGTSF